MDSVTVPLRVTQAAIIERAQDWLSKDATCAVIALRGNAVEGPDAFDVEKGGETVRVRVRLAESPLAVLDAITGRGDGELAVVVTPLITEELGDSLLARIHGNRIRGVSHWNTVKGLAGAKAIEPELLHRRYDWLAEAAAACGTALWTNWAGGTTELSRETLLSRLAAHRLGRTPGEAVDIAVLLEWTNRHQWADTWAGLPEVEQDGLADYLAEPDSLGASAKLILELARKGEDVLVMGLVARELYSDDAPADEIFNEARIGLRFLLRSGAEAPSAEQLRAFGEQSDALVARWAASDDQAAQDAALDVERRTSSKLVDIGAAEIAARSRWLSRGFDAALERFGSVIAKAVKSGNAASRKAVEDSLKTLAGHRRADEVRLAAPRAAVRLNRWLTRDEPAPDTLASFLAWQATEGGWVDRASAVLHSSEAAWAAPLLERVQVSRRELDRAFAGHLSAWGGKSAPDSKLLCVEEILKRVVRPVARSEGQSFTAPLILVIDGMSTADATSLAENIVETRQWLELVAETTGERRQAALAAMPSETRHSRTSLLSGRLATGGQSEEDRGFQQFWNPHPTVVLHKDDLRGMPGEGLPAAARAALADPTRVVAAVLNQIDDALDADARLANPEWRLAMLDHAKALLDEAARAGRPLIVCSDHGNIRDRGSRKRDGDGGSRWTPGDTAQEGEIVLDGGRLSVPGPIRIAVDEDIRYVSRRAGYHGGASLAEAAIPVLVFRPAGLKTPPSWTEVERRADVEPAWWREPIAVAPKEAPAMDQMPALLTPGDMRLGARVLESTRYQARLKTVGRNQPQRVGEIIDLLDAAGGKLPLSVLGRGVGLGNRNPAPLIKQAARVLNETGAQVLAIADGGAYVELNLPLLKTQYLGGQG